MVEYKKADKEYVIIDDELKRLTNRCIAKALTELDHLHNSDKIILKNVIRHFEKSIRNNILNERTIK